jgi:hypothetical protein
LDILLHLVPFEGGKMITLKLLSIVLTGLIFAQSTSATGGELIYFHRPLPPLTIRVFDDGRLVYAGDSAAGIPFNNARQLDKATITSLIQQFETANFFALNDEYLGVWGTRKDGSPHFSQPRDIPPSTLKFSYNGKSKNINYVSGVPLKIEILQRRLMHTAGIISEQ